MISFLYFIIICNKYIIYYKVCTECKFPSLTDRVISVKKLMEKMNCMDNFPRKRML